MQYKNWGWQFGELVKGVLILLVGSVTNGAKGSHPYKKAEELPIFILKHKNASSNCFALPELFFLFV